MHFASAPGIGPSTFSLKMLICHTNLVTSYWQKRYICGSDFYFLKPYALKKTKKEKMSDYLTWKMVNLNVGSIYMLRLKLLLTF